MSQTGFIMYELLFRLALYFNRIRIFFVYWYFGSGLAWWNCLHGSVLQRKPYRGE